VRAAAFALALSLVAPTLALPVAALAGPNCVDRQGEMIRCGAPRAMPVGWSPPPDEALARLAARSDGLDAGQLIGLVCVLGGLFALFALLPDFDGGWDRQEDDAKDEPKQGRRG
jgi:hypothetical protein